jgi:hypothetical protein
MGDRHYAGDTVILQAWVRDPKDARYPLVPLPSSMKVKVLSADEATEHLAEQTMSAVVDDTGTASAGSTTTLTDSTKDWSKDAFGNPITNRWKGRVVKITGGTGVGQERIIASNTATALTVATKWTTAPDATSVYQIVDGLYEHAWASSASLADLELVQQVKATLAGGDVDTEKRLFKLERKVV